MGGTIPLHSARGLLHRTRAAACRALTAITTRLIWQAGFSRLARGCGYLLQLWLGQLLLPALRGLRLVVASGPFCLLRLDRRLFYRNSLSHLLLGFCSRFWRWLRKRGTGLIAMLVVSIGLGIFLRYVYLFIFGGSTRQYASFNGQPGISLGPIDVTPKALIAAGIAIVVLTGTVLWLKLTRIGKASRAIADNPALASASGIDVNRVVSIIWMAGAALAALAGVVYSLSNGINWIQGFQLLLLIFAGVTLGGLGTATGAIVGSIIVGTMIQLSTLVIPSELKNVGALGVLIVILMIRPQGILGRSERVG